MYFKPTFIAFLLSVPVLVQGLPQLASVPAASASASSIQPSSISSDNSSAGPTLSIAPATKPSATSPGPVPVVTDPSIAAALLDEPSSVDRFKKLLTDQNGNLLTGDALRQKTVFDFNQQKPAPGSKGGSILLATIDNFPILTGLSLAGAVSFVGPCGLNVPHIHPRANEFFVVVKGVLETGFVLENGFNQEVSTALGAYQGTVFPAGSIHYQQNPTCDEAVFVAGFDSSDPGRSDIATNFWMLDSDVVNATLGFPSTIGGETIDQWKSHIPPNLALGVYSCLKRCGISPNTTA